MQYLRCPLPNAAPSHRPIKCHSRRIVLAVLQQTASMLSVHTLKILVLLSCPQNFCTKSSQPAHSPCRPAANSLPYSQKPCPVVLLPKLLLPILHRTTRGLRRVFISIMRWKIQQCCPSRDYAGSVPIRVKGLYAVMPCLREHLRILVYQ
jgi:hypothetical protein